MNNLKNIIASCMLSSACGLVFAGSPGGLQILLAGTPRAASHAGALVAFFKRYDPDSNDADCENAQLNIDSVELHVEKTNISPELALDAANNARQRSKLATLMTRFRDRTHDRGFDGVLAYDVQNDNIVLYGISAMPSIKIYASAMPLADLHNEKKTSFAICHALVHLPVLAER